MKDLSGKNQELLKEISVLKQRIKELEHSESDHKQAEEALLSESKFNALVIENAGQGICVCHEVKEFPYVRFTVWNECMTLITGYSMAEINRLGWYQSIYPDPAVQERAVIRMRNMRVGENIEGEEGEITRADGQKRQLLITTRLHPGRNGEPIFLGVMSDVTERMRIEEALRESENKYRELSIVDGLTQLFNSRYFYHQLKMEMDRADRYGHPLTILFLDLDDFKQFNDTYGHIEGDQVLLRFGHVVKRCLRQTDTAYRYGGEEFTVILPMTTSRDSVVTAERIRTGFKNEHFSAKPGDDVHVTVSIGLAQYKTQEEIKTFVHRADQLMYQGKKSGKDRVCSESSPQEEFEW